MSKEAWGKVPMIKRWKDEGKTRVVDIRGYILDLDESPQSVQDRVKEVEKEYNTKVIFLLEDDRGWMSYIFSDTEPWMIDDQNVGFMALEEGVFMERVSIGVIEKYGQIIRTM